MPSFDSLLGHPKLGSSWEGYVIEQIASALPMEFDLHFYRTHRGAEIDLVITRGLEVVRLIEIKYSHAPSLAHGFYTAWNDFNNVPSVVVYPGEECYSLADHIQVLSLERFMSDIASGAFVP